MYALLSQPYVNLVIHQKRASLRHGSRSWCGAAKRGEVVVGSKRKLETVNRDFDRYGRLSSRSGGALGGATLARLLFLTTLLLQALGRLSSAQQAPPSDTLTPSDAMRLFAREKSAAEQYAVILSTIGKNDATQYVRGIRLYADAKAEF